MENIKAALNIFNLARKERLGELQNRFEKWMENAVKGEEESEYNRFINEWQDSGEAQRAYYTDHIYSDLTTKLNKNKNTKNFNWEAEFIKWLQKEDVNEDKIKEYAAYIAKSDFWNILHKYRRINFHSIPETSNNTLKTLEIEAGHNKLKWLGKPEQFGFIFSELAEKGYIEIPPSRGEGSYGMYAKICFELFDFAKKTTVKNLERAMNPKKNELSQSNKEKLKMPEMKEIS